ncbi:hypothetical protein Tco_0617073 [Tanacetum coccineum]
MNLITYNGKCAYWTFGDLWPFSYTRDWEGREIGPVVAFSLFRLHSAIQWSGMFRVKEMLILVFADSAIGALAYLSLVSHTDLRLPKHQVASSEHIGYLGHASFDDPFATNVFDNTMSNMIAEDRGVVVQSISSIKNCTHSSGLYSSHRITHRPLVNTDSHAPVTERVSNVIVTRPSDRNSVSHMDLHAQQSGDHNTISAGINTISNAVTSASSNRPSDTVATYKEAAIDIACGLTASDDDSKTTFLALLWLIGVRKFVDFENDHRWSQNLGILDVWNLILKGMHSMRRGRGKGQRLEYDISSRLGPTICCERCNGVEADHGDPQSK